jgi:hypothetical protein
VGSGVTDANVQNVTVTGHHRCSRRTGRRDANVQNVTVTVWLDTETDLPVKARREIEVAKGDTTATVTVSYRFTDYDEPTAVTGPNLAEKNSWTSGCPGS